MSPIWYLLWHLAGEDERIVRRSKWAGRVRVQGMSVYFVISVDYSCVYLFHFGPWA